MTAELGTNPVEELTLPDFVDKLEQKSHRNMFKLTWMNDKLPVEDRIEIIDETAEKFSFEIRKQYRGWRFKALKIVNGQIPDFFNNESTGLQKAIKNFYATEDDIESVVMSLWDLRKAFINGTSLVEFMINECIMHPDRGLTDFTQPISLELIWTVKNTESESENPAKVDEKTVSTVLKLCETPFICEFVHLMIGINNYATDHTAIVLNGKETTGPPGEEDALFMMVPVSSNSNLTRKCEAFLLGEKETSNIDTQKGDMYIGFTKEFKDYMMLVVSGKDEKNKRDGGVFKVGNIADYPADALRREEGRSVVFQSAKVIF